MPEPDLSSVRGAIHLIGVGGIGMSALARLLLERGYSVSGSDKEENPITLELAQRGLKFYCGHRPDNVEGAGAVVVSTAITGDNPELAAAVSRSLPVWHRSRLLSTLSQGQKLIAISGTHGKTTSTGMVAQVLLDCGLDPTVVVGGLFNRITSNAYFGSGQYFVAEADESDGTHAQTRSFVSVITNIEPDHLENYPGGMEQIKENMVRFASNSTGFTVLCLDDEGCRQIEGRIRGRVITYGAARNGRKVDYSFEDTGPQSMRVFKASQPLGQINLRVPGQHNKLNALAAAAIALELDLSFADIASALSQFAGVDRRFQILGKASNITVVDDYAHHPTELVATLQAARQFTQALPHPGRIVAIFQPHQPGRLRDLWSDFVSAFTGADLVLLLDIYIARGQSIDGISSKRLAAEIKHPQVHYLPGPVAGLASKILPYLNENDLVLTIGAGDITKVGPEILRLVKPERVDGRSS